MNSKVVCGILIACAAFATVNPPASAQQASAGQNIKQDAKAAGKGIGHGARDIGHATRDVAKSVGKGAKEAGLGIGHGARDGWHATTHAAKHVFHKDD